MMRRAVIAPTKRVPAYDVLIVIQAATAQRFFAATGGAVMQCLSLYPTVCLVSLESDEGDRQRYLILLSNMTAPAAMV